MTDTNKPNTPAPSPAPQSGDKNTVPLPGTADGPKVSPLNFIPDGSETENTTPPTSAVADGPKASPFNYIPDGSETENTTPSTSVVADGPKVSPFNYINLDGSEAKKGQ